MRDARDEDQLYRGGSRRGLHSRRAGHSSWPYEHCCRGRCQNSRRPPGRKNTGDLYGVEEFLTGLLLERFKSLVAPNRLSLLTDWYELTPCLPCRENRIRSYLG